jgi:CoA-transferase family III
MTLRNEAAAWAASGAMFLTGRPDEAPLLPPVGFVARLRSVGDALARSSVALGRRVDVDVLALLGERAALAGLRRGGDVNCGGSARLLRTADGWLAVNLPRPEDRDLLPAWLAGLTSDPTMLADAVATSSAESLAERAQVLGLPVAALPCRPLVVPTAAGPLAGLPVTAAPIGAAEAEPGPGAQDLLVADLSSLWAGPLCTHLLQQAGARVVKVESVHRPDGARFGPAAFFDLLHAGQEAVAFDFREVDGRAALRRLLEAADVVVEGSRPRALEQLGINAEALLTGAAIGGSGPRVWVSITGYGRAAPGGDRVAFGDDAAVAGGLVAWDDAGPCFCADAVADPCAGLVAAAAVLGALAAGGRWLLDVSMRDVAAHLAGSRSVPSAAPAPPGFVAEAPRARPAGGRGPRLGEHTEAVLAEIEVRRG